MTIESRGNLDNHPKRNEVQGRIIALCRDLNRAIPNLENMSWNELRKFHSELLSEFQIRQFGRIL